MLRRIFPLAAVVLMLCAVSVVHADSHFLQKAKLSAIGGSSGDNFGYSLALSANGRTALVGAYEKGNQHGAAYVFTRAGSAWKEQHELASQDGTEQEAFGWSVALSGDGGTALIGAIGKHTKMGSAYVFTRTGSTWKKRDLAPSDGAPGDNFAFTVAMSGDGRTALIGAPGADAFRGRAYMFERIGSAWVQKQELTNPDGLPYEGFASSVALSADGRTALIGAYEKYGQTGSAYVFARSGTVWKKQQELTPPVNDEPEAFGWSMALNADGGTAIIGAIGKNAGAGAAYIFKCYGTVWKWQREFTVSGKEIFGTSVALSGDGDTALIGANGKNERSGAAYVFTSKDDIWSQKQVLSASDAAANNDFGVSVALSAYGNTALVGSLANSAYMFAAPLKQPNWNDVAPYVKNLFGVMDDGSGIEMMEDGTILRIPSSGHPDTVFETLGKNLPQLLHAIRLYQSANMNSPLSGTIASGAVENMLPAKDRGRILDMAIEALKGMLQSLEQNKVSGK